MPAREARSSKTTLRCEILSCGIAEGPLWVIADPMGQVASASTPGQVDPDAEMACFRQKVDSLAGDLQLTVARLKSQALLAESDIIRTRLIMIHDPVFHRRVEELIRSKGVSAVDAIRRVIDSLLKAAASSSDPFVSERASDLQDLAAQLRAKFAVEGSDVLSRQIANASGSVLATPELLASLVLKGRRAKVRAFVVEKGTALSHGAILANAFGLPVVRVKDMKTLLRARQGTNVLVDGVAGELLFDPDEEDRNRFRRRPAAATPSVLGERLPVGLWINIADPAELEDFDWEQVLGVGLYRTETLFMVHTDCAPTEDEQYEAYRQVFELCGNRPVTIRTLDLGADKTVPYLPLGPQDNPYLGLRAHRLFRRHPELLVTQVRAVLRAAHGPHRLRLMYPMVESIDQWRFIQELVGQAIDSLRSNGHPFQERFAQGILIEVPSAVWEFDRLLSLCDFASVGTNDLVQYLFAAERNNSTVAYLYRPEHPIFLRLLRHLATRASAAGKSLSLCGVLASEPKYTKLLVGLGLTDLSVAAGLSPTIRAVLGSLDVQACQTLASACCEAETADDVRRLLPA